MCLRSGSNRSSAWHWRIVPLIVGLIFGPATYGQAPDARVPDTQAKKRRSLLRTNALFRKFPANSLELPGSEGGERNAGTGSFSTGFEPAESFVPGFVGGQQGWLVGRSLAEPHIDAANPAAGTQHLRTSKDPAVTPDITNKIAYFGVSPDLGPLPTSASTTSIDVAIGALDGAAYFVIGQSTSDGFITWWVLFWFTGQIFIAEKTDDGLNFKDTSVNWVPGPYKNLTVCDDPISGTTNYYYDGVFIYSQTKHLLGGRVEQLAIGNDNFHLSEHGDFDNLSIKSGLSAFCEGGSICGDNIAEPDEECDGSDDVACLDDCQPDCKCRGGCGTLKAGDCCVPNGTRACDDDACCSLVCELRPICCQVIWDEICAAAAAALCSGTCSPGVCPGEGDCCAPNGTPFCRDGSCCQRVCGLDPFCCDSIWDEACAELALLTCSPDVVCTGDSNDDGNVGQLDWSFLHKCLQGPDGIPDIVPPPPTLSECLQFFDSDKDNDGDLFDFSRFGFVFTGDP